MALQSQMRRAARMRQAHGHLLQVQQAVGLVIWRSEISRPAHFLRSFKALWRTKGPDSWWPLWQRAMIANMLVIRCPTGKEVS
jgi:hypothetical protein